jgi:hypothetical protein
MKFSERYGYVKPSDVVIREQITPIPGAEEALFMLVSCSAFINFFE